MFGPGRTCAISSPSIKRSWSIQPRLSTCCRTLAFWPPPNAVDEIAAKVSAISPSPGFFTSTDIRQRPIHDRRRVLAREDVDMNVFGVLVRRQHAHSNHETLLIKSHDQRDFLHPRDEAMPNVCVAEAKIQDRRHPLFRDDDDVDFPPFFFTLVDVMAEREDVVVLVDDFIRLCARAVEATAKRVLGIGFFPLALFGAANELRNPLRHAPDFSL